MMIRAALFILSSASFVAFLACMSTKRSHFSVMGQNSLAIFVLHGFAVIIADKVIARTGPEAPWSLVLVVLASVITTLVLAFQYEHSCGRYRHKQSVFNGHEPYRSWRGR